MPLVVKLRIKLTIFSEVQFFRGESLSTTSDQVVAALKKSFHILLGLLDLIDDKQFTLYIFVYSHILIQIIYCVG